jgi:sterol desaturase/sphingolipid hydroxylase (fatty acid hydroxylase superfamily)
MLVFIVFAVLLVATKVFARSRGEWLIDGSGLLAQGAIATLFAAIAPRGRIELPFAVQVALSVVVVDYAFYWNHRLLHGALWRWHAVHHTARRLDVLATSRNTLWAPLLLVYVWTTAAAVVLLRDPRGWLAGLSLTAALDLWRHSPLTLPAAARRALSLVLITPQEHAWHHSTARCDVNFGANLSWWDRLHGTYDAPPEAPASLGVEIGGGTMRRLLAGSR